MLKVVAEITLAPEILPLGPVVSMLPPLIVPVTVSALVVASNTNPVVLTLASWLLPAAPTITGYSVVVLVLSVAFMVLLGPTSPCVPCAPVSPWMP